MALYWSIVIIWFFFYIAQFYARKYELLKKELTNILRLIVRTLLAKMARGFVHHCTFAVISQLRHTWSNSGTLDQTAHTELGWYCLHVWHCQNATIAFDYLHLDQCNICLMLVLIACCLGFCTDLFLFTALISCFLRWNFCLMLVRTSCSLRRSIYLMLVLISCCLMSKTCLLHALWYLFDFVFKVWYLSDACTNLLMFEVWYLSDACTDLFSVG